MWSFVLLVEADKAQWLGQTEGSDTEVGTPKLSLHVARGVVPSEGHLRGDPDTGQHHHIRPIDEEADVVVAGVHRREDDVAPLVGIAPCHP
jgi:hypothetical protein